jgi:hypothetical protein
VKLAAHRFYTDHTAHGAKRLSPNFWGPVGEGPWNGACIASGLMDMDQDGWSRSNGATPGAPRAGPVWAALGLALLVSSSVVEPSASPGIRRGELQCEEAVARLVECCPDLRPRDFFCEYEDSGGCAGAREPDLDGADYEYLRSHSCDEVREAGWCSYVGSNSPEFEGP